MFISLSTVSHSLISLLTSHTVAVREKREKEKTMHDTALRQALLRCLGNFPARVPLNPRFDTPEEESDHTRIRVTYDVEAGERIAALLLVPHGPTPAGGWPAILAIHQHNGEYQLGKSEVAGLAGEPTMHYGLALCRRGYIVLCPDLLCFEERRPPLTGPLTPWTQEGRNYERFIFTSRLLHGSCLQTKYLHDLMCAVDLLSSLPQVNSLHLGVIGHSLGGQEALWLSWYDARIAATVSSCGFGLLQTILRDGILHNLAAYIPGLLEVGDMEKVAASLAPRPFLLTAGESDPLFPLDGIHTLTATMRDAYGQAGVFERFQPRLFPGPHRFPTAMQEEAYTFLDRWLKA